MRSLFWVDTETTGLDPKNGRILEIAMVATTLDLQIVREDTFLVDSLDLDQAFAEAGPYVVEMHTKNELWADLAVAKATGTITKICDVADRIRAFVRETGCAGATEDGDWRSPLCGSTVSFDRMMINAFFPQALRDLSYRHIDVSSIHEIAQAWYDPILVHQSSDTDPAQHRALPDIKHSIRRLQWYRGHVFLPSMRLVQQGPGAA
jgi:oligoribonuclease